MTGNAERRPTSGSGVQQDRAASAITTTVRRTRETWRARDERRKATRDLDRLLPEQRARRVPSTFGLTPEELRRHRADLLTTGGVSIRPETPWTPGEVAVVLDLGGRRD